MTSELKCQNCGMELMSLTDFHPNAACKLYRQMGQAEKVESAMEYIAEHHPKARRPINAEEVREAGELLREECKAVFGSTWNYDDTWRFVKTVARALGHEVEEGDA